MESLENPFAGQGPVLLDIGGDVGALVVVMPAETQGWEVEIRPAGATAAGHSGSESGHSHDHSHAADSGHAPAHDAGSARHPHVGVVRRPGADGPAHSLVYPEVRQGSYELVRIPGDLVAMTAEVTGGVVTYASWPRDPSPQ